MKSMNKLNINKIIIKNKYKIEIYKKNKERRKKPRGHR